MSDQCPDCGQPFGLGRKRVESPTGRTICSSCSDDLLAAAAGVIANPEQPVAGAIATRGWFRRLRARRRS